MTTNYHTLKYLVQSIKDKVCNSIITESFTQEKDTLHIALEKEDEAFTIELNATGQGYMFLRPKLERAKKNSLDVFSEIFGERVIEVGIHSADRVVEILLDSGKRLLFQFFTGRANFFLVDVENKIISSFKNPKKYAGKEFKYEKIQINYELMIKDFDAFKKAWENLATDDNLGNPARRLVKTVDTIDMLMAKEILHRSGGVDVEKIWEALREVDLELKNPKPRIYYERSFPKHFSIIELTHLKLDKIELDDVNYVIRKFVIETKINKAFYEERKSIEDKLKHLFDKTMNAIEKIKEEIEENKRAQQYEIFGSILMANLNSLSKGMSEVELVNIFSERGEKVKIKLDPSLSPVENAERYFEKAKRTKASLRIAQERLERLELNSEKIEKLIQKIESCKNLDELKKFKEENFEDLKIFGIVKDKISQQIGSKFRRFIVDCGFEVWVGKDAKSNDLLTFKFSDKEDIWFHARGVSGAHVVLKTGKRKPSKKAIERAGSIAAYFSQAKTSSLVPVIMTKRKYIRKPKGAPEGSVVVEREDIIMVEPKLPTEEIE